MKKIVVIMSILFLSLLVYQLAIAQKKMSNAEEEMGVFPDELAAMKKLEANPTQLNREALARIRYNYAIGLAKKWDQSKGEDAYKRALLYAESATILAPKQGKYWALLGQLYAKMENYLLAELMAEDVLRKAVELTPTDQNSRLLLGQILYSHERYSLALEQFEAVLRRDSKMVLPEMITMMCCAYLLDSQFSRGVIFFRALLKNRPQADSVRLALAILLHQQRKNAEAERELRQVIKRPGAPEGARQYALKLIEEWKKE